MQTRTRIYSSPVEGRADTRAAPRMIALRQTSRTGKAHEESKIHHLFASRSPPFFLFSNERLSPRGGGGEDLGRRLWGGGRGEVVRRGTARPAGIMAAVRRGS